MSTIETMKTFFFFFELSLGVRKPQINISNSPPTSAHVVQMGFKKKLLAHPKTISSIFSCQTRLELHGTGIYGQMKLKKLLFSSKNTQDGFGEHRDKK